MKGRFHSASLQLGIGIMLMVFFYACSSEKGGGNAENEGVDTAKTEKLPTDTLEPTEEIQFEDKDSLNEAPEAEEDWPKINVKDLI